MPPIPVHLSSPISTIAGREPDGMTPNITAAEDRASEQERTLGPAYIPATTTGLAPQNPLTAQPGASPGPAPTNTATQISSGCTPTPTVPRSSTQAVSSPPPPQPGAVPPPFQVPPTQLATRRPSVPPPPKAGEVPKLAAYYALQYGSSPTTAPPHSSPAPPPPLPYAAQQPSISTPIRAQPPASVTSTPHDLSHPPGYVQNFRASFEERPAEPYQPLANRSNYERTPSRSNGGILVEEEEGFWGEAVSWVKKVGGKVAEGEEAIWRRINGKK